MTFDFDTLPNREDQVIVNHSRSFTLASRFLPRSIRDDVRKLYAWCRWCDDAVDRAPNRREAARRLALLQKDVDLIYAGGEPKHPASQWLAELVTRYDIPREYPWELLQGMNTDLHSPVLESVEDLRLYCFRSAGTVGLMMCRIMGVDNRQALRHAESLGIAMQLTNIVRDIGEDWDRGRRYIPQKWLRLVPGKDLKPGNRQVLNAAVELLAMAEQQYTHGLKGLKYLPAGARFAIRLAGSVYREIGRQIGRQQYRVMDQRIFVPRWQKLRLCVKCLAEHLSSGLKGLASKFKFGPRRLLLDDYQTGSFSMNLETRYLFFVGVGLTCVMGATLFVLVGINPKASSYESLPWIYAGVCGLLAAVNGLLARWTYRQLQPEPADTSRN